MKALAAPLVVLVCGSLAFGCGSDDQGSGAVTKPFGAGDLNVNRAQRVERARALRAKTVASDKVAEVGARTSLAAMEVYAADHNGSYVGATAAALRSVDPAVPASLAVQAQVTGYSVAVTSEVGGTEFTVTRAANRKLVFSCSAPGKGDCPAGGNWAS